MVTNIVKKAVISCVRNKFNLENLWGFFPLEKLDIAYT